MFILGIILGMSVIIAIWAMYSAHQSDMAELEQAMSYERMYQEARAMTTHNDLGGIN